MSRYNKFYSCFIFRDLSSGPFGWMTFSKRRSNISVEYAGITSRSTDPYPIPLGIYSSTCCPSFIFSRAVVQPVIVITPEAANDLGSFTIPFHSPEKLSSKTVPFINFPRLDTYRISRHRRNSQRFDIIFRKELHIHIIVFTRSVVLIAQIL